MKLCSGGHSIQIILQNIVFWAYQETTITSELKNVPFSGFLGQLKMPSFEKKKHLWNSFGGFKNAMIAIVIITAVFYFYLQQTI